MDGRYQPEQCSPEKRKSLILSILKIHESLSDVQKKHLELDRFVIKLLKNDDLLWGQIAKIEKGKFSEN